jgi:hypothetical protein
LARSLWIVTLLFNSREWVTADRWNRSLELFACYVTPHFSRGTTSTSAPSWPTTHLAEDDSKSPTNDKPPT